MAEIRIENITKTYPGGIKALNDISLTIADGEFMVLLGPSGCGKTTLLRMIAGFEQPDSGAIWINGRDVTELPPRRRALAMVFQSYALFPHLKVFDNIAFGLRMHRRPKEELQSRVSQAAELMEIAPFLDRYPTQLSGGQRQRVAVARALAMDASVILMDEPLSNLDALLRLNMRAELKRLLKQVSATTVYVTHDQVEALSMGDRTAVMRNGEILQVDEPMTVYDRPSDPFVAGFIGNPPMNLLEGQASSAGVEVEGHSFELPAQDEFKPGDPVLFGVRAENLELLPGSTPDGLSGRVLVVEPLGSFLLVTVAIGKQRVKVSAPMDVKLDPGQEVGLRVKPGNVRLLRPDADRQPATPPC
jgi:multiple sugar transport system ATP-binding protein